MIDAICADCKCEFLSIVIQGYTVCPKCGSKNTAVAIYDTKGNVEAGSALNEKT